MRGMVGVGRHGWSGVWLEVISYQSYMYIYVYIIYIYLSVLHMLCYCLTVDCLRDAGSYVSFYVTKSCNSLPNTPKL